MNRSHRRSASAVGGGGEFFTVLSLKGATPQVRTSRRVHFPPALSLDDPSHESKPGRLLPMTEACRDDSWRFGRAEVRAVNWSAR